MTVALSPADAEFDGPRTITAVVAGSTISFAFMGANVASTATGGTVVLPDAVCFASVGANLATNSIAGTVQLTSFDGLRTITGVTADTISFTSTGADIASGSATGTVTLSTYGCSGEITKSPLITPSQKIARLAAVFTPTDKSRTTNVATLAIAGHTLVAGQAVRIALNPADAVFDGVKTITAVNPGVSISFTSTGTDITSAACAGTVTCTSFNVTNKARTTTVATLTIVGHGLVAGEAITVQGVDATLDGAWSITSVTADTIIFTAGSGTISSTPCGGSVTTTTQGNRVLVFPAAHGLTQSSVMTVALNPADPNYDGVFTVVSVISANALSYNHSVNWAQGTASTLGLVKKPAPTNLATIATMNLRALGGVPTNKGASTTACYLRVPPNHGLNAGDSIQVALNPSDARFDGNFTVSRAPSALPILKARISTFGLLFFSGAPPFQINDPIQIALFPADAVFDGFNVVTGVGANYISFTLPDGAAISTTGTAGAVTGAIFYANPGAAVAETTAGGYVGVPNFQFPTHRIYVEEIPGKTFMESMAFGNPGISYYFDTTQTNFTPIIATELLTPVDEIHIGSYFNVRVKVTDNNVKLGLTEQPLLPASAYVRFNFNGDWLEMTDPSTSYVEELGPVRGSDLQGTAPNNYYDIYTDGYETDTYPAFTKVNPICFTVQFYLKAAPTGPLSIRLSDSPSWTGPGGLSQRTSTVGTGTPGESLPIYMAHSFNSDATRNIVIQRLVKTEMVGDSIVPGETFRVRVKVSSNDAFTGVPVACAFRVTYNADAMAYESASGSEFGAITTGAEQGSGISAYRDISTAPNLSNTNALPVCYVLTFRLKSSAPVSFSISAADDPAAAYPLQGNPAVSLAHEFDNSASANLTRTPQIGTTVVDAPPKTLIPAQDFQVRVSVLNNDTSSIPISAAIRANYTTQTLEFLSVQEGAETRPPVCPDGRDGVLGQVLLGPNLYDSSAGTWYRRAATKSSSLNSNKTPKCYTLTFRTKSVLAGPIAVTLLDPSTGTPLMEKGTYASIPHVYINNATSALSPVPASVLAEMVDPDANTYASGSTYQVRVRIASAGTSGATPVQAVFQMNYDSNSVTVDSVSAGDLGAPSLGPLQGAAPNNFRLISTANVPTNTNLTPVCFVATMRVASNPSHPYAIAFQDDSTAASLAFSPRKSLAPTSRMNSTHRLLALSAAARFRLTLNWLAAPQPIPSQWALCMTFA